LTFVFNYIWIKLVYKSLTTSAVSFLITVCDWILNKTRQHHQYIHYEIMCIYLRILMSNNISTSDDVHVV